MSDPTQGGGGSPSTEVGALSIPIRTEGAGQALKDLASVDAAAAGLGKKVAAVPVAIYGADEALGVLKALGYSAKQVGTDAATGFAQLRVAGGDVAVINGMLEKQGFAARAIGPETQASFGQARAATAGLAQATTQAAVAETELAAATESAAVASQGAAGAQTAAGQAVSTAAPRYRMGANALIALTFALQSGTLESRRALISLGTMGVFLGSSLPGAAASYATGIGAAVAVTGLFVEYLDKLATGAKPTQDFLDRVGRFHTEAQATDQLKAINAEIGRLQEKDAKEPGPYFKFLSGTALTGGFNPITIAQQLREYALAEGKIGSLIQRAGVVGKKGAELATAESTADAPTRAEISAANLAAQNAAADAAARVRQAHDDAAYALGRQSLDKYYADRIAATEAASTREVKVLEDRRASLGVPGFNETASETAKRVADQRRVATEIGTVETRGTADVLKLIEDRRKAREALDKTILGYEQAEAAAAGDSSAQQVAAIHRQATEYARALVDSGKATQAEAAGRARLYEDALSAAVRAAQGEVVARREVARVDLEREAIQQRVDAGQLTAVEGSREIAALERARLPVLIKLADEAVRLAEATGNPDTINAAKQARSALNGLGVDKEMVGFGNQLRDSIAGTISGAISGGFAAGVKSGSVAAGFKALGGSFLQGLGSLFVMIGERSLAGLAFIQTIVDAITGFAPAVGVAAALGLIALGGILEGLGSGGGGGGGGRVGGGGIASAGGAPIHVVLGGNASSRPFETPPPTMPGRAQPGGTLAPRPVYIGTLVATNPRDPEWQRMIHETVNKGARRGNFNG